MGYEYDDTIPTKRPHKRSRLEIYYDVLFAIKKESEYGEIKPTRVQFLSNTSYDKLSNYLADLEEKKWITSNPLEITEKGNEFFKNYDSVKELMHKLGLNQI